MAECCLAFVEAATLINVVPLVGALSHVALRGNAEVYDVRVHEARPQPGQVRVARRMRGLLDGLPLPPARIQDPFGLRAFAQVLGPAVDHVDALGNSLRIDINASAENPLVAGDTVLHNGNWHAMPIALALDSLRLSLHSVATLSTSRVANLVDPDYTGLSRFLASGAEASSGVMMIEYVAHDALAAVRSAAQPATLGTATLSRGAEHHASFAPQAAVLTAQLLDALREVLASELVTAVRAIRLAGLTPEDLAPAAVGPWLADALARPPRRPRRPLPARGPGNSPRPDDPMGRPPSRTPRRISLELLSRGGGGLGLWRLGGFGGLGGGVRRGVRRRCGR